jgi:8-oxo-dGTP pyrophosphatase MutT (NUDIX family)
MYITIHFGDKPVFLADSRDPDLSELLSHPETVLIEECSAHAVHALLHEIKKTEIRAGVMIAEDLAALRKLFWSRFQIIQAAGGLVENELREFLFIFRRGYWDLPKGKIDEGETIEACAIREIQEETGLKDLRLIRPLCTTYHTYEFKGEEILKESFWFHVEGKRTDKLIPQTEEDIQEIIWADRHRVGELLRGTYPSIRAVLVAAGLN